MARSQGLMHSSSSWRGFMIFCDRERARYNSTFIGVMVGIVESVAWISVVIEKFDGRTTFPPLPV